MTPLFSLVLCCAFSNGLGTAPHWLSSPGQLFLEVGLSSKSESLDLAQALSRFLVSWDVNSLQHRLLLLTAMTSPLWQTEITGQSSFLSGYFYQPFGSQEKGSHPLSHLVSPVAAPKEGYSRSPAPLSPLSPSCSSSGSTLPEPLVRLQ